MCLSLKIMYIYQHYLLKSVSSQAPNRPLPPTPDDEDSKANQRVRI